MAGAGKRILGLAGSALLKGRSTELWTVSSLSAFQQMRGLGGGYEVWGKPSAYTEGTKFLGTPDQHLTLTAKRPMSPDVFEIDSFNPHYKLPLAAWTSITTRGTGCVLSVGCLGAGFIALMGDVPATVDWIKSSWLLCFPAKFGVAFPLIFHYFAGLRHLWWDSARHGKQSDKTGPLELKAVEQSSMVMLGGSTVAALVVAMM